MATLILSCFSFFLLSLLLTPLWFHFPDTFFPAGLGGCWGTPGSIFSPSSQPLLAAAPPLNLCHFVSDFLVLGIWERTGHFSFLAWDTVSPDVSEGANYFLLHQNVVWAIYYNTRGDCLAGFNSSLDKRGKKSFKNRGKTANLGRKFQNEWIWSFCPTWTCFCHSASPSLLLAVSAPTGSERSSMFQPGELLGWIGTLGMHNMQKESLMYLLTFHHCSCICWTDK